MHPKVASLLKQQPINSTIEVQEFGDGLKFKLPRYGLKSSDWMVTLYSVFWIIVFGAGAGVALAWYDQWYIQLLAILVILGLLYWIGSEVNAINEQQTITLTKDNIMIDKKRQFKSRHFEVPISLIQEINIETYPFVRYGGEETELFMEFSSEQEKIWLVKLMKIWVYQVSKQSV